MGLTIYGIHKPHFSVSFLLKIGLTVLFTHLKIILLQYFQFSVSATISSIQTDLKTSFQTSLLSSLVNVKIIVIMCIYIYICGGAKA